jgi:hypothetical protein
MLNISFFVMLSVVMLNVVILSVVMLNVVILSVIMLNVVTPCVVAPNRQRCHKSFLQNNLDFSEMSWNVCLPQIFLQSKLCNQGLILTLLHWGKRLTSKV